MDIEKIMEEARRRIEEKKKKGYFTDEEIRDIEEMELKILPDESEIRSFYESHLYQEVYHPPTGIKKWIKDKFQEKFFRFFFFFMRPLLTPEKIVKSVEYIKILHNISHSLVTELSKQRIKTLELEARVKSLEEKVEILERRIRAYEEK